MTIFKNSCITFAAAVVLTAACKMVGPVEEQQAVSTVSVSFTSEMPATRAAFTEPEDGNYPVLWQEGDEVKLFLNGSEVNESSDKGVMKARLSADAKVANFEITLPDPGELESFNYGVLSPASAFLGWDMFSDLISVTIPDTQHASALSCDPAAMLLWAAAGPYGDVHDPVKLPFQHLTAYGKLSLTGLKGSLSEVELVSDRNLAGVYRHPSQTDPHAAVETLSPEAPVGRIRILATDPESVWFACLPSDWGGSTLTVTATTSEGFFTKSVTFPAEDREMKAGWIARISVDMSTAADKTDVFDEGHIVFSFGAISDTHIESTSGAVAQKFISALNQLKSRAAEKDVDGLDAVVVAGDLTQTGSSVYAQTGCFKSLYEQVFKPRQVPMIYTVGNHDANPSYWWTSSTIVQAAVMSQVLGDDYFLTDQDQTMRTGYECRDNLIAGFHILSVTPTGTNPVTYPAETKAWLDAKLQALTEADPERYIILNTHPMIDNTCYGSLLGTPTGKALSDIWDANDSWATRDLTDILKKYPQVVTFGGHLHFPLNDPRSFWQGDFTSLGCGSTRYMAIENGKYEDMSSATVMKDCNEFSQGWLIQLDRSGNLRATAMDFYRSSIIGQPYEIPYPHSDKSHLTRFAPDRKDRNQAPVFPEGSDCSIVQPSPSSPTLLNWEAARDDQMVHHYVLEVKQDGAVQIRKKFLADFYLHPLASDMKKNWSTSLGTLATGTYEVVLTAYDSWDASARIAKTVTVEGPQPVDVTLYSDIEFSNGTITDKQGKLSIENRGATIASTTVSHGGQTYTVPAVKAGAGKNVRCQFNEITSTGEASAFFCAGFSVEAMFVDKAPGAGSNAVHGVVCGTQYGGWGLALRANGTPYFIVGENQYNTYVSVDASSAASKTELTHVVCVYDPFARKMSIYVNGTLSATQTISGSFYLGAQDTYNRFCLGADIAVNDATTDFNCTDMVITDAKFYTGTLDAAAVTSAYQAAVAALKQ